MSDDNIKTYTDIISKKLAEEDDENHIRPIDVKGRFGDTDLWTPPVQETDGVSQTDEDGSLLYTRKNTDNLDKTTIMDRASDMPFSPDGILKQRTSNSSSDRNQIEAEIKKRAIKRIAKRDQSLRTLSHVFGGILLTIFIISVSCFLSYFTVRAALDVSGIVKNEFEIEIEVPEYATTEQIAEILHSNGIISLPSFFKVYSSFLGADGDYLNGMFKVSSTMTYNQIIKTLQSVSRKTETVSVRIREGMTAKEIGELLEENLVCKAEDFEYYYKVKQNRYNFEKRILMNSMKCFQLEGYLFPDTYEFYVNNQLTEDPDADTSKDAETVASKIYSNFNSKISIEIYKRTNEMGLTLDELITLASMVQAEAATLEDMELVASVFLNRLHNSSEFPLLQSDVTVFYAEENIKPLMNSRNEGIYRPIITAYNTYESPGLPPGPICNPGMTAIEAVLYAPDTDYYFFCANTETLEVYYAETIQEHEYNLVLAGLKE